MGKREHMSKDGSAFFFQVSYDSNPLWLFQQRDHPPNHPGPNHSSSDSLSFQSDYPIHSPFPSSHSYSHRARLYHSCNIRYPSELSLGVCAYSEVTLRTEQATLSQTQGIFCCCCCLGQNPLSGTCWLQAPATTANG